MKWPPGSAGRAGSTGRMHAEVQKKYTKPPGAKASRNCLHREGVTAMTDDFAGKSGMGILPRHKNHRIGRMPMPLK